MTSSPSRSPEKPARPQDPNLIPYLILLLPPLFWASNIVVGRGIIEEVPPVALSFWRWVIASAVLLPFGGLALWRQRRQVAAEWKRLVIYTATGVVGITVLFYIGVQSTGAINASIANVILPIMIVCLSWLIIGERLTLLQGFGILISLAGITSIITRGDPGILLTLDINTGDLWILSAIFCWAIYSVLLRRHGTKLSPVVLLTVMSLFGVLMIAPLYGLELASGRTIIANGGNIAGIVYIAIFPAVLAYFLWNKGLAAVGANTAGFFTYLVPVYATILAVTFLGERLETYHLFGAAFIFLGVYLAVRKRPAAGKGKEATGA